MYHSYMKYKLDEGIRVLSFFKPPLYSWMVGKANLFLSLFARGGEKIRIERDDKTSFSSLLIKGGNRGLILYFHGGAFVYKAAPYHYRLVKEYASTAGCDVLLVDYSLAPKNKYPKATEDAKDAYMWVIERMKYNKIVLMGDSAGASIALSLMAEITRLSLPSPLCMMLIYPVVAPIETETKKIFFDTPIWNSRLDKKMWSFYLGDTPFMSPLDSPYASLFPPTYIETAEFDALRGEGELLASFLREKGVRTDFFTVPRVPHGFDMIRGSDIAQKMISRREEYILTELSLN